MTISHHFKNLKCLSAHIARVQMRFKQVDVRKLHKIYYTHLALSVDILVTNLSIITLLKHARIAHDYDD
jgi:hypothetical protein